VARTELGAVSVKRLLGALTVLLFAACAQWTPDPDGFTEQEHALLQSMALPAVQPLVLSQKAELGKRLFFDPALAAPLAVPHDGQPAALGKVGEAGRVACADCHDPRAAFSDVRSSPNNVSLGVGWTGRNSPSLLNVGQYQTWAWDGRGDTLKMQVSFAYEAGKTMAGTHVRLARALWANPKHRQRYAEAVADFPLDPALDATSDAGRFYTQLSDGGVEPIEQAALSAADKTYVYGVAGNAYEAMAEYIGALTSTGSPFDQFVLEGHRDALDADQRAGLKLFLGKAGCVECHSGQQFSDNQFHVLALPQRGDHVPAADQGRFDGINVHNASPWKSGTLDAPTEADKGAFRTKSLRNVARSGPWMHAGQFDALEEVVRYYNGGGDRSGTYVPDRRLQPLGLTSDEIRQLAGFLHALDGEEIPLALGCGDPTSSDGGSRFPVCP
jgi:cytochrome c peroxidase